VKSTRSFDYGLVLVVVILLVIGLTGVLIFMQVRTDRISSMVDAGKEIRFVFVLEKDGKPAFTDAVFVNTATHRGAIIDIPGNVGSIIGSLNRVDRIDVLYHPGNADAYREKVGELLGVDIPFQIIMTEKELVKQVDLVEGVELFISAASGESAPENGVLLPAGNVTLDGSKVLTFLRYTEPGETDAERIGRTQKFLQSYFETLGSHADYLAQSGVARYLTANLQTNLDNRSVISLVRELSRLSGDQLVMRRVQGNTRTVDSDGESRQLLFPHFEGQWLRQTVRQVDETLASQEPVQDTNVAIRLEILNGTNINGLARRTADLYQGFGFEISSVGNSDTNDVQSTTVIDRTGNMALAQRAAEIIHAKRVISEPAVTGDSGVDVTVILGKDFDGTYVRE